MDFPRSILPRLSSLSNPRNTGRAKRFKHGAKLRGLKPVPPLDQVAVLNYGTDLAECAQDTFCSKQ